MIHDYTAVMHSLFFVDTYVYNAVTKQTCNNFYVHIDKKAKALSNDKVYRCASLVMLIHSTVTTFNKIRNSQGTEN